MAAVARSAANSVARSASVALLVAALLSACTAPQTTGAKAHAAQIAREAERQKVFLLRERLAAVDRVQAVAFDLAFANIVDCGKRVRPSFGFSWLSRDQLDKKLRPTAERAGIVGPFPTIAVVSAFGPSRFSLARGDVILEIDGMPYGTGKKSFAARLAEAAKEGAVRLRFRRAGRELEQVLIAAPLCDMPVLLSWDEKSRAFTDGKRIVISKGILDVMQNDHELAFVIGHEMAHVASDHVSSKKLNAIGGGAIGLAMDFGLAMLGVNTGGAGFRAGMKSAAGAYSQDYEREADYVGAYFAHRAGYDVAKGKFFWRRMAAKGVSGLFYATTHPTTPERFVALDAASDEISALPDDGAPIAPKDWKTKLD